jgi:diguanylate cyclase (GGDEF)-like protein
VWAGEEFVLLLPETDARTAAQIAERLRASLSTLAIETSGGTIPITASFGVATLAGADDDIANLVRRADVALYRSKREGRDRVTVA